MEEKVKKDFVEGLTNYAYELITGDFASEYVCYEEFLESLEDAFYYGYLEYLKSKEIEEKGEDFDEEEFYENFKKSWNEVKEEVLEDVLQNVKNIAIKEIEDELRDYKSMALFLGVQHVNTPYRYYPEYKLLSKEEIKDYKDAFEKLSEFVKPHAWGVYYDNWGNYWAIVINKENYKELIEDIDIDIAIAVLKRDYVEFTLTKNNANNLRPYIHDANRVVNTTTNNNIDNNPFIPKL